MLIRHRFFLYVSMFIMFALNHASAQLPPEKVLYRKAVSDGQELIVTKGPLTPIEGLKQFLSAEVSGRVLGGFSLTVELHQSGKPPLCLWSKMCWLNRDSGYDEFQILDLLVLPDRLILAMSSWSSTIAISQIGLYRHSDQGVSLKGADWSLLGAAIPAPPGRLSAKLTYDEKEKRIEVQVTDFLEDTKQHTLFHQKGDDQWEFVRVKQWSETVAEKRSD